MAGLPSHIFVVRHGNRLDAADKQWHLSASSPYNPPLTYGGLLQARQVGNQIKTILEQSKIDYESKTKRQRRFKIVIHSSPFLRCIQTSVGISSGLSQPSPDSIFNPSDLIYPSSQLNENKIFKSTILRLDSFLGEWLSPGYFENITPPPGSAIMLGNAKADLLKREDYSHYTEPSAPPMPIQRASALWGGGSSSGTSTPASEITLFPSSKEGYQQLKPNYAVSSAGKIPDGFVAHARDSCVMVDYQWDSMRQPLDFGDGGAYGEEWTAMHKRFRKGMRRLLNWYATDDAPAELVTTPCPSTSSACSSGTRSEHEEEEEEDVETVVIMVSHGAGCNAMIGAITNQPVLMDVGIASLTMATLKPDLEYEKLQAEAEDLEPALVRVDDMYDIRMTASTEHLHRASNIAFGRSTSVTTSTWTPPTSRGRTSTFAGTASPWMSQSPVDTPVLRSSAKFGFGLNKDLSSEVAHSLPDNAALSRGLWTPPTASKPSLSLMEEDVDEEDDLDAMLPDFDRKRFSSGSFSSSREEEEESIASDDLHGSLLDISLNPGLYSPESELSLFSTSPSLPSPLARPATLNIVSKGGGPVLSAPIKLNTGNFETLTMTPGVGLMQFGGGLGGLWGMPSDEDDMHRF